MVAPTGSFKVRLGVGWQGPTLGCPIGVHPVCWGGWGFDAQPDTLVVRQGDPQGGMDSMAGSLLGETKHAAFIVEEWEALELDDAHHHGHGVHDGATSSSAE